MAFTGNKDDVTFFCHHASSTDSLATVYDADYLLHLFAVETLQHVVDNILRFFETWVVRSNNDLITLLNSLLSHQGALAFVTITASSTDSDNLSLAVEYLVDGV